MGAVLLEVGRDHETDNVATVLGPDDKVYIVDLSRPEVETQVNLMMKHYHMIREKTYHWKDSD